MSLNFAAIQNMASAAMGAGPGEFLHPTYAADVANSYSQFDYLYGNQPYLGYNSNFHFAPGQFANPGVSGLSGRYTGAKAPDSPLDDPGLLRGPDPDPGNKPRQFYYGDSPRQLDYYAADLAERYGMDRSTAYQEALSNTAYQRGVADMQAAGLNPAVLFGSGRAQAAGGVYSARPAGSPSAHGYSSEGQYGPLPSYIYYGAVALGSAIGGSPGARTAGAVVNAVNSFLKNQGA